jgi:hypothetical protein
LQGEFRHLPVLDSEERVVDVIDILAIARLMMKGVRNIKYAI